MRATESVEQLNKETVLSLIKAADRVRRHVTDILQSRGVTLQQFNVLRILRGAGPKGLPTLEVGERMIDKTPGVSRLLERLEGHGLVSRERCDEDSRRVLCTLTESALELLAELDDPILQGDVECLAGLTVDERRTLRALASKIRPGEPSSEAT